MGTSTSHRIGGLSTSRDDRRHPLITRPAPAGAPVGDDPQGGGMHDDTPELGTPILILGTGERWALVQVRRHGVAMFIATMTLTAAVAAALLVAIWLLIRGRFDDPDYWVPAMVMAVLIPVLIAPPLLLFSARLVARLDTATQLLRISAVTDPLTGVANRRGFFGELQRFDDDVDVEVAMVDLDSFKSLNDDHGHAVGDEALRTVAGWLVDLIGDQGVVGRVGGDEFAFAAVADGYRIVPSRQRFDVDGVAFTVSIGRAVGRGDAVEQALLAADQALYEQKRARPIVRTDARSHRSFHRPRGHVDP